jgi:hypothetical protein
VLLRQGVRLVAGTALLAICMTAFVPAAASAKRKPHLLLRTVAPLLADGQRYAVYGTSAGALGILDTRSGTARSIMVAAGCGVDAARRGFFLVNCPDASGFTVPHILSARSGNLITVPGEGSTWFPAADDFGQLGTRWLKGTGSGNGHPTTEYLNWRTGQVKGFGEESGAPTVPRDLDSPTLSKLGPRGSFGAFLRQGSFTVSVRASLPPSPLVLRRARHPNVRLDRCTLTCTSISLGPRFVSWAAGAAAHTYVLSTGKRLSWRFSPAISQPVGGFQSGVQQTAGRVFFNVPVGQSPADGFRVYETAR